MDATPLDNPPGPDGPQPQAALADRLVQRALLLTSQVLGRVIDEGEFLSPAGVHGVRVAIKRLRAGWRLLEPALPMQAAQAETRLRALHHALAVDRSRFVRLATLQRECAGSDDPDLRAAFDDLSEVAPFAGTGEGLSVRGLAENVGRTFRAESRAWRELGAAAHAADVRPALRQAYRRLRNAARAAHRGDPDGWHRWRLRLKRVLYQLELVTGPGAGLPPGLLAQWRTLADQLGRLQDLEDLRTVLGDLRSPAHARAGARVVEHVRNRQRRLFRKVKAARDEAFALRPRDFVRLLGDAAPAVQPGDGCADGEGEGATGPAAASALVAAS